MSTQVLTVSPNGAEFGQILNDADSTSIAGAIQTSGRTGNRWEFALTFRNLYSSRRIALLGHVAWLRGRRNRLQIPMSLLGYVRQGAGGGTPLLVGAHVAGATQLSIDGASNHATWLRGSDFITIGNELKMVTGDVTTSGGAGTIGIWPELHQNYADNAAVNISTPYGVFFLKAPVNMSLKPSSEWDTDVILALEEDVLL